MARIVLGIGTSHTPVLSIPGELWEAFAQRDRQNGELMFPPEGVAMPFDAAVPNPSPGGEPGAGRQRGAGTDTLLPPTLR